MNRLETKELGLRTLLQSMQRVVVGFSGGVDSTLVAKVATEELGDNALIVISDSPSLPRSELEEALQLGRRNNFHMRVIHTKEAEKEEYLKNPDNRCFYCKTELYQDLNFLLSTEGFNFILDGANLDDVGDYRPGRKAAGNNGVRSVLMEMEFTKKDVRDLAMKLGLSNYDKPAAACLSSRFPYGTQIDLDKLKRVELAESFLRKWVNRDVRVRYHNDVARIEVGHEDFVLVLENAVEIYARFKELGFSYTSLDLLGFRSGSLNEK